MATIGSFLERWFGRFLNAVSLWSLLPPTTVGVVTAYFASGVAWISQWGAFGWFVSGLLGFVLTAAGMALVARAKLWRLDAKARARLAGESSPFDPMERIYRDKRLFLRDLAPLGRVEVKGRKFINCEIIGPGDIVLDYRSNDSLPFPIIRDNWFHDVNFIQIDVGQNRIIHNAVFFPDCDFEGCNLYSLNLLFAHRVREDFNWITPSVNQPTLALEGGKDREEEADDKPAE